MTINFSKYLSISANFNKFLLISFFLLYSVLFTTAQCYKENTAFQIGEKLTYKIYYNWGFIWLNAGEVYFKVDTATYKNKNVFFFDSYGATYKKYDWFFKVRDKYEAYAELSSLKPLKFKRKTYEGGYKVHNNYYFDYKKNKIYSFTQNSYKPFTKDTLELPPCTFDVLTVIYYSRNIDFSKYNVNDKIPLSIIIDNELFNLYIRYLGKEVIETRDNEKYRCIKFTALLVEGALFSGGEEMTVWVTDDDNKIPVVVEAKILVGSIKTFLIETKGLRHKMSAKINK